MIFVPIRNLNNKPISHLLFTSGLTILKAIYKMKGLVPTQATPLIIIDLFFSLIYKIMTLFKPYIFIFFLILLVLKPILLPGPFRRREKALAPACFKNHESRFLDKLRKKS